MRTPNTKCSVCNEPLYRRPTQLAKQQGAYCSRTCLNTGRGYKPLRECLECHKKFYSKHKPTTAKFCSVSCSNKNRRGITYTGTKMSNASQRRLALLEGTYGLTSCMVQDCDYDKTYDIHRLVPGKLGGEYKLGNMFAICPMHHAEEHRGICKLSKINEQTLKATYGL